MHGAKVGSTATIVVVHPEDDAIAEIARRMRPMPVIAASPPPDMKASVAIGLAHVRAALQPAQIQTCGCSRRPTCPDLRRRAISDVILAAAAADEPIVVPTSQRQRGHPVAFRWALAERSLCN